MTNANDTPPREVGIIRCDRCGERAKVLIYSASIPAPDDAAPKAAPPAPTAVDVLIARRPATRNLVAATWMSEAVVLLTQQHDRILWLQSVDAYMALKLANDDLRIRAEKAEAALESERFQTAAHKDAEITQRARGDRLDRENESLRAECGLRQIQGYNEGKAAALAAPAIAPAPPTDTAYVTAVGMLSMIESGFTIPKAYREAAAEAIKVLEGINRDRNEWRQQHENLLTDNKVLLARAEKAEAALAAPAIASAPRERGSITDEELRILTTVTVRKPTVWERRAFCAGRNLAIESLPNYADQKLVDELATAKAEIRTLRNVALAAQTEVERCRNEHGEWPPAQKAIAPDDARLLAALKELVACKDLRDMLSLDYKPEYRAQHATELAELEAEYQRRKPLAWAEARAAIAAKPEGSV